MSHRAQRTAGRRGRGRGRGEVCARPAGLEEEGRAPPSSRPARSSTGRRALSAAATATPRPATSQSFGLHGDFETSPTDASKCLHVVKLDFSFFNDGTKSPLLAISRLVGRRAAAGTGVQPERCLEKVGPVSTSAAKVHHARLPLGGGQSGGTANMLFKKCFV